MGFKRESLYTNKSSIIQQQWLHRNCQPNFRINVTPDPSKSCGPYKPARGISGRFPGTPEINDNNHDTIGIVVVDFEGNIAAGTSTNGVNHKIPGRMGDSAVPGGGAYVDNEIGGAASTGDGDIMMRFLSSFQTVRNMAEGQSPRKAAERTIHAIASKYPNFSGAIIAANKAGEFGAACYGMETFKFCIQNRFFKEVKVMSVKCL
ncbi:unnamed protein product [Gongylonema pulchrum]|uniref:N(4)-(beta-N-acetylglucosaminyl)-L-asparaginase n=1 Tax=Gongylonema pulchrum TaxID=637853 RepID=A0A183E4H9_9BILA|nr:unnamed protein product [Gongylonema pulchrum]